MKKKLLALLFGTSLVLAACGGGDTDEGTKTESGDAGTTTASAGDAEKTYGQFCASCHNADLSGGVGPELATVGSRLDQAAIEKIIVDGQNAMPGGLIKGDDATAVAAWLAEKK